MFGPQISADDALTITARIPLNERESQLRTLPVKLLRKMADLCGIDSTDLTKREAIAAILENF